MKRSWRYTPLTDREQQAVTLMRNHSLKDTATEMGVTSSRVRALHSNAVVKLDTQRDQEPPDAAA